MCDASLWASIWKLVCNYFLGNVLLNWNPFLRRPFLWACFFVCPCIFFICFSTKVAESINNFFIKKSKKKNRKQKYSRQCINDLK